MSKYFNPVKVIYTQNWRSELINCQNNLGITNPILVTSPGNRRRLKLDSKFNSGSIFSEIGENPNFDDCENAIKFCGEKDFDGVIALGGGSVMDLAKVVMAFLSTGETDIVDLLNYKGKYERLIPSIFLPTTHGTGSEVTMWGTVWDMKEKKKYSISHIELYPNFAILDGNLTLSLPMDISVMTILDALSHSFESIWNKNANEKSTKYAIEAITIILCNVDSLKQNPADIKVRNNLLEASAKAGLAFSNTKTAAAHSISYPLTIRFGIPHGVASSLSLVPLLEINGKRIQKSLDKICQTLKLTYDELIQKIKAIPLGVIPYTLSEWGVAKSDLPQLIEESFTKGRMDNNIVDLTKDDVLEILNSIK
ncbi:MAG: phosphonoacetaldehyde reductase [Candidatus Marinimicrobia bacterium]|nr:phosphonoacetaldehyde reductase [Candidatus Neomarinimicrobiota bacterium]